MDRTDAGKSPADQRRRAAAREAMSTIIIPPAVANDDGPEVRIITCVCCGGDRGHFDDGNQRWIKCRACNGEGEIEIEPEPIERDDLGDC